MILKSNYDEINFNKLYKDQKLKSSFRPKTREDWDKKAPSFNENLLNSKYADDFLNLVDFKEVESIFDFACGPGTLSLKAASRVKYIYAYDYSSKMLEFLNQNALNLGIKNIISKQVAYEDDWNNLPVCDIVFASRCLEVEDLEFTLNKLISKAKKRVYMTFKVEKSFVDEKILQVMNKNVEPKPHYVYLFNILVQMGYLPKVEYITSPFCANIISAQELIEKTTWGIGSSLDESEKEKLRIFFNNSEYKNLEHVSKWAFISIDV